MMTRMDSMTIADVYIIMLATPHIFIIPNIVIEIIELICRKQARSLMSRLSLLLFYQFDCCPFLYSHVVLFFWNVLFLFFISPIFFSSF